MNFRNPAYLTRGNARQQRAYRALQSLGIFRILRDYTPILTGTIPLNIDIRGSDLDVICAAHDLEAFTRAVTCVWCARGISHRVRDNQRGRVGHRKFRLRRISD